MSAALKRLRRKIFLRLVGDIARQDMLDGVPRRENSHNGCGQLSVLSLVFALDQNGLRELDDLAQVSSR